MKKIIKKIIQRYLKLLSRIAILRYKPEIIAIAGSTGKNPIKEELNNLLKDNFNIRTGPKKYNAEIGVPLTIFGLVSDSGKFKVWFPLVLKATKMTFFADDFPEKIILELGISHPNDVDYFLSIIRPQITILTDINSQYADNFGGLDLIAEEYIKLVKATKKSGLVVLNNDDLRIRKLNIFSDAKVIYYGKGEGSDIKAVEIEEKGSKTIFTVNFKDKKEEVFINKFGNHHIYAKLISIGVKEYYKI